MMTEGHVDILNLIGLDHVTFNNSGQDVVLSRDEKSYVRVFRKGGKVTYRSGEAVWEDLPKVH